MSQRELFRWQFSTLSEQSTKWRVSICSDLVLVPKAWMTEMLTLLGQVASQDAP